MHFEAEVEETEFLDSRIPKRTYQIDLKSLTLEDAVNFICHFIDKNWKPMDIESINPDFFLTGSSPKIFGIQYKQACSKFFIYAGIYRFHVSGEIPCIELRCLPIDFEEHDDFPQGFAIFLTHMPRIIIEPSQILALFVMPSEECDTYIRNLKIKDFFMR